MLLQEIQIPSYSDFKSDLKVMYIRCSSEMVSHRNNIIICPKDTELIFNTYYNSFSFNKWVKYTSIDNLFLYLDIKGTFLCKIIKMELKNEEVEETEILSQVVENNNKIYFPFNKEFNGSYAFILKSLKDNSEFYGGFYGSNINKDILNNINLALGICHYKRENYVAENLYSLKKDVFDNKNSILKEHMKIFVSDNSKTLTDFLKSSEYKSVCSDINIKIFENKNSGGAGGFSRAIYEAVHSDEKFTYMILMDDDIIFSHYALERLYVFLQVMRSEYIFNSVIGGAMLFIDKPFIQYGNGETWLVKEMIFNKKNYNLCNVCDILKNEIEEDTNQLAWWFYCFPLTMNNSSIYALPLFFQYDDIDFNQRFKELKQITLNGICVHHESFEKKYSLAKEYYSIRNRLIICSVHGNSDFNKEFMIHLLVETVKTNIMIYRYNSARLAIRAFRDYFKGLDWLAQQNPEKLNSEISESVEKFESPNKDEISYLEEQYNNFFIFNESSLKRILRKFLLNGAFIPSKKEMVVPINYYKIIRSKLYCVKTAINYDPEMKKKFTTERNNLKALKVIIECLSMVIHINKEFNKTVEDYKKNYKNYITEDFWKYYLEL